MTTAARLAVPFAFLACVSTAAAADPTARGLLAEALSAADTAPANARGQLLSDIADTQAALGDLDGANTTVARIQPASARRQAATSVAVQLALHDSVNGLKTLTKLAHPNAEYAAFTLVCLLCDKGDVDAARAAAEKLFPTPMMRDMARSRIALALIKKGELQAAEKELAQIEGREDRVVAYSDAAVALAAKGPTREADAQRLIEQARATADQMQRERNSVPYIDDPVKARARIADAYVRMGRLDLARNLQLAAKEPPDRDLLAYYICLALCDTGNTREAQKWLAVLVDPTYRFASAIRLAAALLKQSDRTAASAALERSLKLMATPEVRWPETRSGELAGLYASIHGLSAATDWARALDAPEVRINAYLSLAKFAHANQQPPSKP